MGAMNVSEPHSELKVLRYQPTEPLEDYQRDTIERVGKVLEARGFWASPEDIYAAWAAYSEDYSASWMSCPRDDEHVFKAASRYLREVEES